MRPVQGECGVGLCRCAPVAISDRLICAVCLRFHALFGVGYILCRCFETAKHFILCLLYLLVFSLIK